MEDPEQAPRNHLTIKVGKTFESVGWRAFGHIGASSIASRTRDRALFRPLVEVVGREPDGGSKPECKNGGRAPAADHNTVGYFIGTYRSILNRTLTSRLP